MKNLNKFVSIAICSSLLGGMAFAQQAELGKNPQVRLLESTLKSETKVQFRMDNLKFTEVQTPRGMAQVPTYSEGINLSEKGMPTLPVLSRSLAVSDTREMKVEVISSKFIEKKNVLIAPSKGMIMRNEDPNKIPYVYGKSYSQNKFFPGEIATLDDPFIVRDVRGQVVNFAPLQYNPVTKTLRIYTEITVAVSETAQTGKNILKEKGTFAGFEDTYKRLFMNYESGRYTPVEEKKDGRMIVIVPQKYKDDINEFVAWKNQRGLRTEVKIAEDIATPVTANAIQKFVKEEYQKQGNDLMYVLLIGDHNDIPAKITSGIKSDQVYGQIVGNDHYNEVFIGRFSCESKADLKTQIDRTIHYERDVKANEAWLGRALCIASSDGNPAIADNGETDIQHETVIANLLESYGYTFVSRRFGDPNVNATHIITDFNSGICTVNYTGHGSQTAWITSHFGTTHTKQLTNYNQLPYIFDVACYNGDFLHSSPCFAEALMRAQKDGKPTGAIAIIASTIPQSWASPMRAQDEMNEILCEKHQNNIKRTFGGVTMNGMFAMVEKYKKDGETMLDTWTVFGDPSLLVRTLTPKTMAVTAPAQINLTDASVNVSCDYDGAIATISANGKMFGTAIVTNGTATINLAGLTNESTVTLTVVGYNKETFIKSISTNGEPSPYQPVQNLNATTQGQKVTLKWDAPNTGKANGFRQVKRLGDALMVTIEPADDVRANEAKVVLVADNVWGDNTGYQFLLDAQHNTFGDVIPASGPLFIGSAPADLYSANFEYLIPANADPVVTTQNIIVTGQGEVVIPAGVYDYCITNPEPASGKMWIAGDGGNQPARYDDFTFEAGKKYTFTMGRFGTGDGADMVVENESTATYTYTVYRDGAKIKEGLTATTFEEDGVAPGSHEYCVEVKYAAGVSPKVCKTVTVEGSNEFAPIKNLKATMDNNDVILKWEAPSTSKATRQVKRLGDALMVTIEPADDVRANEAKVVLVADNVWGDNTGYQFLLDAQHNTFGDVIPASGPLFIGSAPADLYSANFEYLIPANADPVVTTQNIIVTGQGEVVIPAGVYDYCITNPEPASGKMWIAGDGGNQPARYDDFTFEAGKKYTFTMGRFGTGDGADMVVENESTATYTYTVYRDGTKIKEGLTETTYKDLGQANANHEYCVEVQYATGVSPKECVTFSSVETVTAQKPYTLTVVGKTITVTCQGEAMIYDMNGRRLAAGRNTVVYTAQGGYYAVMIVVDGKSYIEKLAVK